MSISTKSSSVRIEILSSDHDLSNYLESINDHESIKYIAGLDNSQKSFDYLIEYINNFQGHLYGVFNEFNEHVGNIGLSHINNLNRSCSMGIFIFKKYQNKGYGKIATYKTLNEAFEKLGFNRVSLLVVPKNSSAIKLYESTGFEYEGRLRDAFFKNNEYDDLLSYSIIKKNYTKVS